MTSKVLLGLPMYGWKGETAMTAETMVIWLAAHKPFIKIIWNEEAKEHLFVKSGDGVKETASYPTPLFLQNRLNIAETYNLAGVAIWEAGQMMAMLMNYI